MDFLPLHIFDALVEYNYCHGVGMEKETLEQQNQHLKLS